MLPLFSFSVCLQIFSINSRSWDSCILKNACIFENVPQKRFRATRAVALDIFKAFHRVWHADVVFANSSFTEFRVRYSAIFRFFRRIWLRVVLDVMLHSWCCTFSSTLLWVISVTLLSRLMILLSIVSVIRHLICGNS